MIKHSSGRTSSATGRDVTPSLRQMRVATIGMIASLILLLAVPTAGQVPAGMKTFFSTKYGFQMHVPQNWTVEVPDQPRRFVVIVRDPEERVTVGVGRNHDVPGALGEAIARKIIADEAEWFFNDSGLKNVSLVWEDRPPFDFPRGYYIVFEIADEGDAFIALMYYVRDDGSGRGLPQGEVTHHMMLFLTYKRFFKGFEQTFHQMAGSVRFFKPSP